MQMQFHDDLVHGNMVAVRVYSAKRGLDVITDETAVQPEINEPLFSSNMISTNLYAVKTRGSKPQRVIAENFKMQNFCNVTASSVQILC